MSVAAPPEPRPGAGADLAAWRPPAPLAVLPGFRDHHLHLLAAAAARLSVDVGPAAAPRLSTLLARVAKAAAAAPPGGWVRAWGYDDALLAERRHPTRAELDAVAGGRPVVLRHRAGHVAVVNSPAAAQLGGPVPPDGILVDAGELLDAIPRLAPEALAGAVADLSDGLAAAGVTAVTDATVGNGLEEIELLADLRASGRIAQRLTAMVGLDRVEEVAAAGLRHGGAWRGLEVGHAKAYVEGSSDPARLREAAAAAAARGWPVALHVVDLLAADLAIEALERVPPPPGRRHRIEHLSLALPDQVERLAALGVVVVTNPGFLAERGGKYLSELSADEIGWLYRVRSLRRAGIEVRAGTDAPVTAPLPLPAMVAAVRRRYREQVLAPEEAVDARVAVELFAGGGRELRRGDAVLLSEDPRRDGAALSRARVLATYVAGRRVYAEPCHRAGLPDEPMEDD